MTAQQPPVALQNVSTLNADDFRRLIKALVPTEGIIASGDLAVTQNGTPNMSVNVAAGGAVIVGDDTPATQGSYYVWNDATVNLVIAASDPTNPRKDIVIAQVRDSFYSVAGDDWRLTVVTGTPAASPAEPALPTDSIKLAVVTVAAAATSITNAAIADSRTVAAGLSGIVNQAWGTYTPTLTAAGANPTMGTASIRKGRYQQINRTVSGWANIKFGTSGSAPGTGNYYVTLPVAARPPDATEGSINAVGSAICFNYSSSGAFVATALLLPTGLVGFYTDSHGAVADGTPFSWSAQDQLWFNFEYESAS